MLEKKYTEYRKRYPVKREGATAMPRYPGPSKLLHPKPPTPEEGMRGIIDANSLRKRNVIRAAQQLQADRISQYNQGLLTPHDLAEAVVEIWLEATEMTR